MLRTEQLKSEEGLQYQREAMGRKELSLRRGNFLAVLRRRETNYSYSVRDLSGERPTIHGSGRDFLSVLSHVTRLLSLLAAREKQVSGALIAA